MTGARQAELVRALDGADWVGKSLLLPRRRHLITGEMLGAFGAFFDASFRRFDFAAGVADGVAALEAQPALLAELPPQGGLAALDAGIPELPCFRTAWAVEAQGPGAADRHGGEVAVRDQLQRLVAAVARSNDNGSAIYRSVLVSAGAELADGALVPRRPPWMVVHKGRLELEGARGFGALQLVANLQVGSGTWDEFQGRGAVSDERVSIGVRTDMPLWLFGWRPSAFQYRPGAYLAGQLLFVRGHRQVYRWGVTGRLDVDVVKRLYFGYAVTRFRHARGWPTWDSAIDAGVRLWW